MRKQDKKKKQINDHLRSYGGMIYYVNETDLYDKRSIE